MSISAAATEHSALRGAEPSTFAFPHGRRGGGGLRAGGGGQAELRTRLRARAGAAGARDEEGEDGGEEEEEEDDDDDEEEEEAEEEALLAEAEGLKLHLSSGSTTGYKGVRKHIPSRLAASKRVATRGAGPST